MLLDAVANYILGRHHHNIVCGDFFFDCDARATICGPVIGYHGWRGTGGVSYPAIEIKAILTVGPEQHVLRMEDIFFFFFLRLVFCFAF